MIEQGLKDSNEAQDLWAAISKAAERNHYTPAENSGRIFDGYLFVTQKEWDAIADAPASKTWDDMTAVERLSTIPIRIVSDGVSVKLSDGRILAAFADALYLLPEFTEPPLPTLTLDGRRIS